MKREKVGKLRKMNFVLGQEENLLKQRIENGYKSVSRIMESPNKQDAIIYLNEIKIIESEARVIRTIIRIVDILISDD